MPSDSFVWHIEQTFVWIGVVLVVALALYTYYRVLDYLEDRAERALEPKVKARADLGQVSGRWLDERGRNRRPE